MVDTVQIPQVLLEKINAAGVWKDGWTPALRGGREHRANCFRLQNGRIVDLVVDRAGAILLLLNPLIYTRGEPVDPSSESFDFAPKDIVALADRTKVKTGWLPWQSRLEHHDIVCVAP